MASTGASHGRGELNSALSVYFFAGDDQEIKALCGVKGMILPQNITDCIYAKLSANNKDKQSLAISFSQILSEYCINKELSEEYNHFQCLSISKVASAFHVRNVLLRLAFSRINSVQLQMGFPQTSCKIYQEVFRYFIDYFRFVYLATPYIELHHDLLTQGKLRNAYIFCDKERFQGAYDFLNESIPYDASNKNIFTRQVACVIDRLYSDNISIGAQVPPRTEPNMPKNTKGLNRKDTAILYRNMFLSLLLIPHLWVDTLNVFLSNPRSLISYLPSRLNGPQNTVIAGSLPGILGGDITIDPVGFAYGKLHLGSQESRFPGPQTKSLSDLLWLILSRIANVECLLRAGYSPIEILKYFKLLRDFTGKWAPEAINTLDIIADIEIDIIYSSENTASKMKSKEKQGFLHMETFALDLYNRYRDLIISEVASGNSGISKALNCSYMHI